MADDEMWSDYVQRHPDTTEAFKQVGVTIEPELTSALAAGSGPHHFGNGEEDPDEDYVFYLGPLPNMLMRVAFKLRPDWAKPPNSKTNEDEVAS